MTTPIEIHDDMTTRCWEVDMIERSEPGEGPGAAVGHMILARTGHLLTLEAGVDDEGRAFVSLRMFGPDCEPVEFDVFNAGGSLMAVTP